MDVKLDGQDIWTVYKQYDIIYLPQLPIIGSHVELPNGEFFLLS